MIRAFIAGLVLGALLAYIGMRVLQKPSSVVQANVDTVRIHVHADDSLIALTNDFRASTQRQIANLSASAGQLAAQARHANAEADSLRSVVDTAHLTTDALRAIMQRQDSLRHVAVSKLTHANDSLTAALDTAKTQLTLDSTTIAKVNADLHDALRRIQENAKHERGRCGLGLSAGYGLRGFDALLGAHCGI